MNDMLAEHPPGHLRQYVMLRAIEWAKWPVFITQPVVPILFLFLDWWEVVGSVILLNTIWTLIRTKFVSLSLAHFGCYFVRLKWITSPGVGIYLMVNGNIPLGCLALFWPLGAAIAGGVPPVVMPLGKIETAFMRQLGFFSFVDEDEALDRDDT